VELSVRAAAAADPQRLAVVSDGEKLNYGQLAARVADCCTQILQRGLRPGQRVAIAATNRLETLVVLLALIELGIAFVPIHPRWTAPEVERLLADAQAAELWRDAELFALCAPPASDRGNVPPPPSPPPTAPLAVLYTSGSSGTAKGALLSRGAFVASAVASAQSQGWQEDDRWLLCLPLCHIGGLSIVTRCLLGRRALILLLRFDPATVLHSIASDGASLLSVVPTMLAALLAADRTGLLGRLRVVLCGGAATPPGLVLQAQQRGVQLLTTYGLTEACSQVTVQSLAEPLAQRRGSGRPLAGVSLGIFAADGTALVVGQVGRIWLRGPTLMDGYLHRPPLEGRWFDTGDLGELDAQHNLTVHARLSELIVSGGENVYPLEVEQALLASPQVGRALVFGVADAQWGATVAAAIVPATAEWDEAALYAELRQRLAGYKLPRLLCLVAALPELPSGKPDRRRAIAEYTPQLRRPVG
jgi:O-succinylbenzoic acid--CoA ligase